MGKAPKGPPDGKEEGYRHWEKGTAMQQRSFSEICWGQVLALPHTSSGTPDTQLIWATETDAATQPQRLTVRIHESASMTAPDKRCSKEQKTINDCFHFMGTDGLHSAFPHISWYTPPNKPPRQTNPFCCNYLEDSGFQSTSQLYAASPLPYLVCALASSPVKKKNKKE